MPATARKSKSARGKSVGTGRAGGMRSAKGCSPFYVKHVDSAPVFSHMRAGRKDGSFLTSPKQVFFHSFMILEHMASRADHSRSAPQRAKVGPKALGLGVVALISLVVACGIGLQFVPQTQRLLSAVSSSSRLITPNTPPLVAPTQGLSVFFIGHSLVGRDMPAMLDQMAEAVDLGGHGYESQLGWGATLRAHYEDSVPIPGFDTENAHPRFRPAHEAISSGSYDALVLTEMVELRDALRWHHSAEYLQKWIQDARRANPDVRVFLYETWHNYQDPLGWEQRLQADAITLWEQSVAARTWRDPAAGAMHIIPVGRVFLAYSEHVAQSEGEIASVEQLFARTNSGDLDPIHLSDLGNYLSALTHFAVIYQRDPRGLPLQLTRADGTPAQAPNAQTAELMQSVVWEIVTSLSVTGILRQPDSDS